MVADAERNDHPTNHVSFIRPLAERYRLFALDDVTDFAKVAALGIF
jgi:hypothetical protein